MNLLVLIPALNEEEKIGRVIGKIPKTLNSISEINILVIDDGSMDQTSEIAKKHGAKVIKNSSNQGVGKCFQIGLEMAIETKSDILVNIDADGQFDPQEIEKLIAPIINRQADLVTGSRFIDRNYIPKNMPILKQWGNHRVANIISWATGKRLHDVSCGFRAYSKEAILRLNLFGKFTYTQETMLDLAYKGLEIAEVPVTVTYFEGRKSRIANNLFNYAYKSGSIIFRTIKDYRPLKFFGLTGIFIFTAGIGFDFFVLNHFLNTGSFSPYKIFGFIGIFLNFIGIMIFFIGILADLIDKVRITQEKILYYEKKRLYDAK